MSAQRRIRQLLTETVRRAVTNTATVLTRSVLQQQPQVTIQLFVSNVWPWQQGSGSEGSSGTRTGRGQHAFKACQQDRLALKQ